MLIPMIQYFIIKFQELSNGGDVINIPGYVEVPAGLTTVGVDVVPIADNVEKKMKQLFFISFC